MKKHKELSCHFFQDHSFLLEQNHHLLCDTGSTWATCFLQGDTLQQLHRQESHQAKSSQGKASSRVQGKPGQTCCAHLAAVSGRRKLREKGTNDGIENGAYRGKVQWESGAHRHSFQQKLHYSLYLDSAACDNIVHAISIFILFQFIHFPVFWVIEFDHEFNKQYRVHCKYENFTKQIATAQAADTMQICLLLLEFPPGKSPDIIILRNVFFGLFTVHGSLLKTVRAEIAKGTQPQICLKTFPE